MTTSLPDYIAWPMLAFMAIVVAVRYAYFSKNQFDTYLNNTLAILFAANLLRDRTIEHALADAGLLSITTSQQLSLVGMIFASTEFMGFITLWSKVPPARARRQQRTLRAVAVALAIAFWIAASRARAAGETLEVSGGWDGVLAWTLLVSLLIVLAVRMCQMAYQESTRPEARRQERILAAGSGVLGVIIGISSITAPLGAALDQLGWIETSQTRMTMYGFNFFFEAFGACLMASTPWLRSLIARAGFNATSRHWRRLQPLRADLTAAVPESAFELKIHTSGRRKTSLDLHQTTVQIRDALLRLRPYSYCLDDAETAAFIARHSVPAGQRDAATEALQLAHAVRARAAGATPAELEPAAVVHSRSMNLDQESGELLRLARWWPHAQAFDDTWTQTPERMSH